MGIDPVNDNVLEWCQASPLAHRGQLAVLLNIHGLIGHAVEVGVHRAEFAEQFISEWCGERYHAIDPWRNPPGYVDEMIAHQDRTGDFQLAMERLRQFGDRVHVLRSLSVDAVKKFKDKTLDFVYVDADHRKEKVIEDINLWLPKVKSGGVLAGHDLVNGGITGPREAVYEVLYRKHGLVVHALAGDAWTWYCFLG